MKLSEVFKFRNSSKMRKVSRCTCIYVEYVCLRIQIILSFLLSHLTSFHILSNFPLYAL